MKINNNSGVEFRRTELANGVQGAGESSRKAAPAQPAVPARGSDKVQISDAGRALAAQETGTAEKKEALSPERVAEIRQRVLEGAYNSVEVVDQVARRMLERGDI